MSRKLVVEVFVAFAIGAVAVWVLLHPRPLFTHSEPQRQERVQYGPYGEIVRALNANYKN